MSPMSPRSRIRDESRRYVIVWVNLEPTDMPNVR
jgi:hypothetical protein